MSSSSINLSKPANLPTLLFLALPPKTFIGIDLFTFNSSPHFHGITSIPSGFHFLYTGTDASLSIRHGRWFYIPLSTAGKSTRPLVWKWDVESESLEVLPSDSDLVTVPSRGLIEFAAL